MTRHTSMLQLLQANIKGSNRESRGNNGSSSRNTSVQKLGKWTRHSSLKVEAIGASPEQSSDLTLS